MKKKMTVFGGVHKTSLRFLFLCSNHHDPEHHHSGILVTLWLGLRQAAQLRTDLPTFSLLSDDACAPKGREAPCYSPSVLYSVNGVPNSVMQWLR